MGTELTPTSGNAGEIAALSKDVQAVVDRASATGKYSSVNAFLAQALNADTIEQATEVGEVIQAADHLNERIRYMDVVFLDSDPELESDIPIFAVCTVVREMGDGVQEKMTCGAGHVVGVLIRAAEKGWFPFDAELVSVGLGAGRKAINLQLSPQRVETLKDL
jgi:hypothetical protein